MRPTRIAAFGILLLEFEDAANVETSWGLISSDAPVVVASTLALHDGSIIALQTSRPDLKRFIIPRVRNTAARVDIGFAVVNTGTTAASMDVVLRSASNQALASRTLKLGPREQTALFAYDFFQGLMDPAGTTYSYLDFHSSSPQFAATASLQGPNLTGLTVERIQ